MRQFIQPALLLLLLRNDAHGYNLLDELAEFGVNPEQLDPSLIYRTLRDMEESGWVASRWGEESLGPRRRVYQLLPEGKAYLAEWVIDLRRTRDAIDHLLQRYEQEIQSE